MKYNLKEIVDVTMGQSPKSQFYNTEGQGIPFLQGNRTFGLKYPTFDTYTTKITKEASMGDVIMSVRAPVGELNISPINICLGRGVCSLRMKNGNQEFLYYMMKYYRKQLIKKESGTVFGSVNKKDIEGLEVNIPENIEVQKKIARFLSMLDEKIELNNSINKNLIQQTQELFKAWFVTFKAFGGEMPSSWKSVKLGDIASIKTNSFSPAKNPTVMLEHYSIPAFDEQKYPIFELASNVKSNKYILTDNSVMISKLNPNIKRVWRPMCISEFAVSSTEFIIFEANDPTYKDFVFSVIDSAAFSDWMCAHTTGSTNSRQRTTPSTTLEFKIALPNQEIIYDFCQIVTPMYDMITQNICENQKLATFRDSLLPKLMSGELDVSDIEL